MGLNLRTLDKGEDSRVFYGAADPAKAVLLTSSANTLDSVIPGVTIDLKNVSSDPVTLTVSRDSAKIESAINNVITAYNTIVDRIATLTKYDPETDSKGALLGESTVGNLRSALARTALSTPVGVDGEYQRLTDVGITFTDGGKLSLDRDKLRSAMENDFQAVKDLFAAREQIPTDGETEIGDGIFVKNTSSKDQFSKLGMMFIFEQLGDQYLDSVDGILPNKDKTFTDQIDLQQKRVDQFNVQLEAKRQRLQTQFLAMEQALASLQSQQSALGSLTQSLG
ncbi:MAG: flagellar filament capping protein FliD [Phycisphaerales bacterium]|nr:flagellar filament capping protein FliD [Phycisphaerales bacterium]